MSISKAFATFLQEAPSHAAAWMQAAKALDEASALEKKTEEIAYIAVLARWAIVPVSLFTSKLPERLVRQGKKC